MVLTNSEQKTNYVINNSCSKIVLEDAFNLTTTIDVSTLQNGLYSIQLVSDDHLRQFKFIKE